MNLAVQVKWRWMRPWNWNDPITLTATQMLNSGVCLLNHVSFIMTAHQFPLPSRILIGTFNREWNVSPKQYAILLSSWLIYAVNQSLKQPLRCHSINFIFARDKFRLRTQKSRCQKFFNRKILHTSSWFVFVRLVHCCVHAAINSAMEGAGLGAGVEVPLMEEFAVFHAFRESRSEIADKRLLRRSLARVFWNQTLNFLYNSRFIYLYWK